LTKETPESKKKKHQNKHTQQNQERE